MAQAENIVFLDIDGCLTSADDGTYFNPDPSCYHVSDALVAKVVALCKAKNAKVVISSNWRRYEPDGSWKNQYGEYRNPLPSLVKKLGSLYIGTLPKDLHMSKSNALILWMEQNEDFTGGFVIFDDDVREAFMLTDEYGIKDHYVHVDSQHGITDKDIQVAMAILRG